MTEESTEQRKEHPVAMLDAKWPGRALPAMPGDFSQFVPQGMGLGMVPIIRPWDDPLKALTRPNFYGFEARDSDPVRGAPTQDPSGGMLYFDDGVTWEELQVALSVIGVRFDERDYAVFAGRAEDTVSERYLDQVRIVSKSALAHMFGAGREASELPKQPIAVGAFIERFLSDQRTKWNDRYTFSERLSGTFGGDGDLAKESLAFGFLVENTYWGVYRLWSRAWLVTK